MLAAILAAYIFSADALAPGSSPRELPSQGRDLESGAVVVGLHSVPPALRAACGWFEVVANPPATYSNEYAAATGYVFDRALGTATRQYEIRWREPQPVTYSKMRIVAALRDIGAWPQVKQWIIDQDLYDLYLAAQDVRSDNEYFAQGRAALQQALGLTDAQVEAILEEAEL